MKRKLVSVMLALIMLVGVIPFGSVAANAENEPESTEAKTEVCIVSFTKAKSIDQYIPVENNVQDYIADRKTDFENQINQLKDGKTGVLVEDYNSLFTNDQYAQITRVETSFHYDFSEDCVLIGDLDNWDSLVVAQGWVKRIVTVVVIYDEYTLRANLISNVSVTVASPQAGTSSADVKPQVELTSEGCSLASALWLYGLNMYTSDEPVFDFEEGQTYYMYVMLKADSDLEFAKSSELAGGIDEGFDYFRGCTVTGGELKFAASRKFNDGEYLRLKIAVTAAAKAEPSSIPAVSLEFAPPEAGANVKITEVDGALKQTPAPDVTYASDDDRYYMTGCHWYNNEHEEGSAGYIDTPFTFESGTRYYATAELKAYDGYCFNEKTEVNVENANISEYSITTSEDESVMVITFWFEAESNQHVTSYFAVWMCDVEHTPNKGGSVTIEYVAPDGSIPAESGTNWTSSTNQTVPFGTLVTLSAKPDEGYRFKGWYQANIDRADANDPYYLEESLISKAKIYSFTDNPIGENKAPYICAVFEEGEDREVDQIQVWVGNTTGEGAAKDAGGKVAVKYEITGENLYNLESKSGTDFVYGEIVPFYKGDEITVYAQADEDCYFVGWYHVNIEWGPGEGMAYEGAVISKEKSFTYKPGETVLEGDTEPLRYICAVFVKPCDSDKPTDSDIPTDTDTDKPMYGDVNCDGKITMEDITSLQKIVAKLVTYESFGKMSETNADCDFDGKGTMIDVTLIQKYLAKLITSFEPAK
ncbi:MAG: hypothetical protein K6F76_04700 [Clostridiales bacterium]|nr:hypothetical protein [Clostridiales bacterium]